jgi:hypothetical protein
MKPWKKAAKERQGKKRAAPGEVDAQPARRVKQGGQRRGKREQKESKRPKAQPERDAIGRQRRSERVLLEKLKRRRRPLRLVDGKFPLEWAFQTFAGRVREDLGLSKKGMSELCVMQRGTLQNAEGGKHSASLRIVDLYCSGTNTDYVELARILQKIVDDCSKG